MENGFSWIRTVLWDRLKANVSRVFRIYHILLPKLLFLHVKTIRNNSKTDKNKSGQYRKSRHDITNGFYL